MYGVPYGTPPAPFFGPPAGVPGAPPYGPGWGPVPYSAPAFYTPFPYVTANIGPRRTSRPGTAAALWTLVFIRHLLFLVIVSIWMVEMQQIGSNQIFPLALVQEPGLLVATLVAGLAGTIIAILCDLTRKHHFMGFVGGAVSTAACVTPGLLLGFGIVGAVLGAFALALHFVSRSEFAPSDAPGGAPSAAPSP